MLKDKNATMQLAFVTIIVLVVAVVGMLGANWMDDNFGSGGAMMFVVMVFVVVVIFIQQYLSGQQTKAVLDNIVNYAAQDAKVDAYRQQTQLEHARAMRGVTVIDAKSTADTQKMIEQKAGQLAAMMTDAQVAKMRSELFSQSPLEIDQNMTLD